MKLSIGFCVAALVAASPVFAATQGTPGPTSTGTVTINATITPEVAISDLDDFTFTATQLQTALNTSNNATLSDDVCFWSNNVDKGYFITATGDGAGGAFTMTDGTRTLAYAVGIVDGQGFPGGLTSGVKSPKQTSTATAPDCGGGTSGKLSIQIANAAIATMEATTTYTGVLTLLVTPS